MSLLAPRPIDGIFRFSSRLHTTRPAECAQGPDPVWGIGPAPVISTSLAFGAHAFEETEKEEEGNCSPLPSLQGRE